MKKTTRLGIRVSPEEKKWWQDAANQSGMSLSAWISHVLNGRVANVPQQGLRSSEDGYNDHNDS
jgi:hypothetical protein